MRIFSAGDAAKSKWSVKTPEQPLHEQRKTCGVFALSLCSRRSLEGCSVSLLSQLHFNPS